MTIPPTNLQLERDIWLQDSSWGGSSHKMSAPETIPAEEVIKDRLAPKLTEDIKGDIFYAATFLENLYSITDNCAMLAFHDTNMAVDLFANHIDSRLSMTLEALRNELTGQDYEEKAIYVLMQVQHSIKLFLQFCESENVTVTEMTGQLRIQHLRNILCHYEIDLLEGTEKNQGRLFDLLVDNKDIDSYPAVRKILLTKLEPGKKIKDYIPIYNFLENHSMYVNDEFFKPLLLLWNRLILRKINGIAIASKNKQYLAQKIHADLVYIFHVYGPDRLGLSKDWLTLFNKNMISSGRARKLGFINEVLGK